MSDFSLKFTAQLRDGFDSNRAEPALAKIFKLAPEQVDGLVAGPARVIKSSLTKEQAHRWVKTLWAAGWHSSLLKAGKEVYSTVEIKASKLTAGRPQKVRNADLEPATASAVNAATKPVSEPAPKQTSKQVAKQVTKQAHLQRIYAPRAPGSICILKGWQRQETLNPNACIQAGCQDRDAYMIVIAQPKKDIQGAPDLMAYTKAVVESAAGFIGDSQIEAPIAKMPHRELEGLWGEVTGQVNDSSVHYLISVFEGVDHYYAVYFWTGKENFKQVRPLFNAMNASFSCTKTRRQEVVASAALKMTH